MSNDPMIFESIGGKTAMEAESWEAELSLYRAYCIASGNAISTVKLRCRYVRRFAATTGRGPWQTTIDDLVRYMSAEHWLPETRKAARGAMCSFFRWGLKMGRIDRDPSVLLPSVPVPTGVPNPASEDAVWHALRDTNPRDRLMVLLGAFAGLRCNEIATLHTDNLANDELRVRGKGGKIRVIPAHPAILVEIESLPAGYVFPGKHDGHLSSQWVGKILRRALRNCWSGHALRHRFASVAYAADRDIRAVQELLGHSKLETTMIYTKVPNGALKAAVAAAGFVAA